MDTNVTHSHCVSASVATIDCQKTLLLASFIDIEDLCKSKVMLILLVEHFVLQ